MPRERRVGFRQHAASLPHQTAYLVRLTEEVVDEATTTLTVTSKRLNVPTKWISQERSLRQWGDLGLVDPDPVSFPWATDTSGRRTVSATFDDQPGVGWQRHWDRLFQADGFSYAHVVATMTCLAASGFENAAWYQRQHDDGWIFADYYNAVWPGWGNQPWTILRPRDSEPMPVVRNRPYRQPYEEVGEISIPVEKYHEDVIRNQFETLADVVPYMRIIGETLAIWAAALADREGFDSESEAPLGWPYYEPLSSKFSA